MDNAATGERKRGARLRDLFIMEECQGNRWYCLSMMHHTSSLSRAEMLETTRSLLYMRCWPHAKSTFVQ